MYDDPAMTRDMGARARLAARQYDRKIAVQAYHELFERVARRGAGRMIKRTFDCALAGVGLVVSAPLWALLAAVDQAGGRRAGVLPAGARRPRAAGRSTR